MNNGKSDWYPRSTAGERLLYGNIDAKIDGYSTKYPFLDADYLDKIHTMCRTFIECYDKIEYNRATGKQATKWFENIVSSKQDNMPASAPPVYQAISLPARAFIGLEKFCRDFAGLFKKQLNYDKADGLDLMIEREAGESPNLAEVIPELKYTVLTDNSIDFDWKKTGFDMLELQYRKEGTAMWKYADKSTEKVIKFAPPLTTAGVPEKFEFRAIYLIKNQRVGQWSQIYSVTVG